MKERNGSAELKVFENSQCSSSIFAFCHLSFISYDSNIAKYSRDTLQVQPESQLTVVGVF